MGKWVRCYAIHAVVIFCSVNLKPQRLLVPYRGVTTPIYFYMGFLMSVGQKVLHTCMGKYLKLTTVGFPMFWGLKWATKGYSRRFDYWKTFEINAHNGSMTHGRKDFVGNDRETLSTQPTILLVQWQSHPTSSLPWFFFRRLLTSRFTIIITASASIYSSIYVFSYLAK